MRILGDLSIIENGVYIALWHGYTIELAFSNGNFSHILPTEEGIRGFSRVLVEVKDGEGTILNATNKEIECVSDTYRVEPNFLNRFHRKIVKN